MSTKATQVNVDGQPLKLSNLDKVLYPEAGFTKAGVIDYYSRIAPVMLPHLAGRPLTLKRYPEGVSEEFFYEKQCPTHRPDWVPTATVPSPGSRHGRREIDYCLINSRAALVWVANLASLEMHVLLARQEAVDKPTLVVFDLDPGPPAGLVQCAEVALELRDLLDRLDLRCLVKSSGGKGLHLYIPLNTGAAYDQTKPFARALAELMESRFGDRVTANMRKDLRRGKVFIDWSQNDSHKTTVCVYSLRARPRPTVSMPLRWDEIEHAAESGDASGLLFEPDRALDRVGRDGDLFQPLLTLKQKLPRMAKT